MYVFIDEIPNRYGLDRTSPAHKVITICRRHIIEVPDCVHDETTKTYSNNMSQLSMIEKSPDISSIVMYLTERSFFGTDSMVFMMDKMLNNQTIDNVLTYFGMLQNNFYMHPPCAKYMAEEYHKLMLVPPEKHFDEMASGTI